MKWDGFKNKLDGYLATPWIPYALLVLVALLYTVSYLAYPELNSTHPAYWFGRWFDQTKYQEAALAIAKWNLDATTYWYPPGYSILAAPFCLIAPDHAMFMVDLLCILIAVTMLYKIAQLHMRPHVCVLFLAVFFASHRWLLEKSLVVPWNTTAILALFYTGIWMTLSNKGTTVRLAAIAAVAYLIKPVDAVCFAPMLIYSVLRCDSLRSKFIAAVKGVSLIAIPAVAIILLNYQIFGEWQTPYDKNSKSIGLFGYPLIYKLYWIFVDFSPTFSNHESALLFRYPWLFLAPSATLYWAWKQKWPGVAVLTTILISSVLYLNYNDFWPTNIYRFWLVHYFFWWMPLVTLMIVWWGLNISRDFAARLCLVAVPFVILPALCLKLDYRPPGVPPTSTRLREIRWPQDTNIDQLQLYSKGSLLSRYKHYHSFHGPGGYPVTVVSPYRSARLTTRFNADPLLIPVKRAHDLVWKTGFFSERLASAYRTWTSIQRD